jgi:hypothetical protein
MASFLAAPGAAARSFPKPVVLHLEFKQIGTSGPQFSFSQPVVTNTRYALINHMLIDDRTGTAPPLGSGRASRGLSGGLIDGAIEQSRLRRAVVMAFAPRPRSCRDAGRIGSVDRRQLGLRP